MVSRDFDTCGKDTAESRMQLCTFKIRSWIFCGAEGNSSYIVDAADREALPIAKEELHGLLKQKVLEGIPLLVLGNKSDLAGKLSVDELIEALDMKAISHREVSCYGISAKEETNLDAVLQWLIKKTSH